MKYQSTKCDDEGNQICSWPPRIMHNSEKIQIQFNDEEAVSFPEVFKIKGCSSRMVEETISFVKQHPTEVKIPSALLEIVSYDVMEPPLVEGPMKKIGHVTRIKIALAVHSVLNGCKSTFVFAQKKAPRITVFYTRDQMKRFRCQRHFSWHHCLDYIRRQLVKDEYSCT